jgi:hypothetical protein
MATQALLHLISHPYDRRHQVQFNRLFICVSKPLIVIINFSIMPSWFYDQGHCIAKMKNSQLGKREFSNYEQQVRVYK